MSQLPNSWHSVPLLDVSELIRGVTYSKTDVGTAEGDDYVGVMRANNIQDRQFDLSDLVYVPRRLVADGQYVREGDVVVATSSGSISVVGKAAQATREMNLGFGAFCGVLRPSSLLCKRFFGHYFSSESYRNYVASVARGVNINNLKRSHFEELNIPLAPLPEQQRIADKLDSLLSRVDSCRERFNRVPAILRRFRQSVLAAATSGKLTEDWRNENMSGCGTDVVARDAKSKKALLETTPSLKKKKSSLESDIDTEFVFKIPSNWCFTSWGVTSEWITYGFTRPMPHVESGIKLVTAKDVQRFLVDFSKTHETSQEAFAALSEKDKPSVGDMLLTKDGTIGRAALVRDNTPFCINQSVAVAWLRSTCMNKAFLEIVANAEFTQEFIREKSQGMAIQHLSIIDFAKCPLPVPPIEEQVEISRRVETLFAFADRLEDRYFSARRYIDQLPSALLAKAFRGELVPQDPNDEPASLFLERIRGQHSKDSDKSKKKGRSKMARTTQKSNGQIRQLTSVLQDNGGRMTPEKLLVTAGYTEESIEDFYLALKKCLADGAIEDPRDYENEIVLVQART